MENQEKVLETVVEEVVEETSEVVEEVAEETAEVVEEVAEETKEEKKIKFYRTDRGLFVFLLLSFITFGIYPFIFYTSLGKTLNKICRPVDGKKTMNFCLLTFVFAPITAGIAEIVWFHRISKRIGNELSRRGVGYAFGAADFWLWNVVGSLIFVGPFIYFHKLCKAMNKLCESANEDLKAE